MPRGEGRQVASNEMTHEMIETRFHAALARDMGLEIDRLDNAATLVLPEQGRAGSEYAVAAYRVRQLTALRVDPAFAIRIEGLADRERALSFEDVLAWAEQSGWGPVDGADSHLVAISALVRRPLPAGATLTSLDRDDRGDHSRIAELMASCDPDDVDAAEIELDDLDPLIVALLDQNGRLGSFVSGRRWEVDERFDDIGVITRDDLRGCGWGSANVAAFCGRSFELDRLPLYRCNWSRPASKALALSVGFRPSLSLLAISPRS